ncbi:MAG TPA: redoxin domain-containing protein [Fuerstia sp.]|nr:redoxin domain-containing protein [Fuerstiella sp.]
MTRHCVSFGHCCTHQKSHTAVVALKGSTLNDLSSRVRENSEDDAVAVRSYNFIYALGTVSKFVLAIGLAAPGAAANDPALDYGFESTSTSGEKVVVEKDDGAKLTVVCFLGAECPMARIYGPRLSELAGEFSVNGVRVIGVNSNRQDSMAKIRAYVDELSVSFPVIHDRGNVIADRYAATRTPEVFLLDEQLQLQYHGRIDDQYAPGINRAAPTQQYLRVAIEQLLAGKHVSTPKTTALGCFIGKVDSRSQHEIVRNDITYSRHVTRVLQKHCVECHRAGEIGPFVMDSYDQVAGWADTMLETVDNGRMPPWHADPNHGSFANARDMSEADKEILHDWVAGGLKQGDEAELPKPIEHVQGWQLERQPDLMVEMRNRPFVVKKAGVVEYQYFVVDPQFEEDKWITGAQVIPGSRAVVHHAIVFVRPPDGARFRGVGWLTAYVPGQRLVSLPAGHGRKIPVGSKLVFQMHYTPNGVEQEDTTKIGLLFGDDKDMTHEVFTVVGIEQEFEIKPHASAHTVTVKVPRLPEHGHLLAVTPHMHYRGKSFRLLTGSDSPQKLLSVPNYDFNWQHSYEFMEPIPAANLDELRFEATFDNSSDNPFNPDPSEFVFWGDQTWEEMAVAFFAVSVPRIKPRTTSVRTEQSDATADSDRQKQIDAYVARFFNKMDANGDGHVVKDEASIFVRHFGRFGRYDTNADGRATKDEIRELAKQLY